LEKQSKINKIEKVPSVENAQNAPKKEKLKDGLLHVSELNRRMQEMIGQFVLLEDYFMVESVKKAIRMDEAVAESLTSSAVDHTFYVLQKSTQVDHKLDI
jgi:hypothetical protein